MRYSNKSNQRYYFISFFFFVLVFISTRVIIRSDELGTDTERYITFLELLPNYPTLWNAISGTRLEAGYVGASWVLRKFFSAEVTYLIWSVVGLILILSGTIWISSIPIVRENQWKNPIFIVVVSSFSFLTIDLIVNIQRSGLAYGIAAFGLFYIIRNQLIRGFFLISLSMLFHISSFIFLIPFLILKLMRVHLRRLLITLIIFIVIKLTIIPNSFPIFLYLDDVSGLVPEHYLGVISRGKQGSLIFLLYVIFPILIHCILSLAKYKALNDHQYILKYYIILLFPFLLFFDLPYSYRLAYPALMLYPILLKLLIDESFQSNMKLMVSFFVAILFASFNLVYFEYVELFYLKDFL